MNSFVEFYNRRTRRVSQVVDQTEWELRQSTAPIDRFAPTVNYDTTKLLWLQMKGTITVASVVGPEDELPNSKGFMQLDERFLAELRIGRQHIFGKDEYDLLHDLEMNFNESNAGNPQAQAVVRAAEEYLIGIAQNMPISIDAKHLILQLKVYTSGTCIYTDPLSKKEIELIYPDIVSSLLPSALTGNNVWSNAANANGLENLRVHAEAYRAVHGRKPQVLVAHYTNLEQLALQTTTLNALGATAGTDGTLASSLFIPVNYDPETLMLDRESALYMLIRSRTNVEDVMVFDAQYKEELEDGTFREAPYLPENYYFFASDGMGERARVPFVENNWQPGVFVRTKELDDAPKKERLAGLTAGVPFVPDARKIAARKVA